jgi:hypothetical protein
LYSFNRLSADLNNQLTANVDGNMQNPWGLAATIPGSAVSGIGANPHFWMASQVTATVTPYSGGGAFQNVNGAKFFISVPYVFPGLGRRRSWIG